MEKKYPIGVEPNTSKHQDIIFKVCKAHGVKSLELTTKHIALMSDCISEYIAREAPTGAVWVKIEDNLPKLGETVLAEYRSGDYERMEYTGPEDWWKRNVKQWLDESTQPKDADWISVDERLPEIAEYVMVYNTERATLIGRLVSNGWVAMFADGETFMGELTATHWMPLPEAPKQ